MFYLSGQIKRAAGADHIAGAGPGQRPLDRLRHTGRHGGRISSGLRIRGKRPGRHGAAGGKRRQKNEAGQRTNPVEHAAIILVGQRAENQNQTAAGKVFPERPAQCGDARRIMRSVEQKKRAGQKRFQARRPARLGQSAGNGRGPDPVAFFLQNFDRGQRQRQVLRLMPAGQGDGQRTNFSQPAGIGNGSVRMPPDFEIISETKQRRLSIPAGLFNNVQNLRLAGRCEADASLFDNPGFFARDVRQRFPQPGRMLQGDVRNHGNQRPADVGGVEPSAEAHLQNGQIHPAAGKIKKGRGRQAFEIGDRFARQIPDFSQQFFQFAAGDFDAVNDDSLAHVHQMRRCVETDPQARLPQHGRQHDGGGAFTVGAADQDRGKIVLRTAGAVKQSRDRLQTETHHVDVEAGKIVCGMKRFHGIAGDVKCG